MKAVFEQECMPIEVPHRSEVPSERCLPQFCIPTLSPLNRLASCMSFGLHMQHFCFAGMLGALAGQLLLLTA